VDEEKNKDNLSFDQLDDVEEGDEEKKEQKREERALRIKELERAKEGVFTHIVHDLEKHVDEWKDWYVTYVRIHSTYTHILKYINHLLNTKKIFSMCLLLLDEMRFIKLFWTLLCFDLLNYTHAYMHVN